MLVIDFPGGGHLSIEFIEEASRYVPIEQLAISPQCGFASDVVGNVLSEDDQWKKLELVQHIADEVFA